MILPLKVVVHLLKHTDMTISTSQGLHTMKDPQSVSFIGLSLSYMVSMVLA